MPILSSLADLHRLLDAFNELGVTVFCVICAALVLTEVLIPKFFKVLKVYQHERHAYLSLKRELQSITGRQITGTLNSSEVTDPEV